MCRMGGLVLLRNTYLVIDLAAFHEYKLYYSFVRLVKSSALDTEFRSGACSSFLTFIKSMCSAVLGVDRSQMLRQGVKQVLRLNFHQMFRVFCPYWHCSSSC